MPSETDGEGGAATPACPARPALQTAARNVGDDQLADGEGGGGYGAHDGEKEQRVHPGLAALHHTGQTLNTGVVINPTYSHQIISTKHSDSLNCLENLKKSVCGRPPAPDTALPPSRP